MQIQVVAQQENKHNVTCTHDMFYSGVQTSTSTPDSDLETKILLVRERERELHTSLKILVHDITQGLSH